MAPHIISIFLFGRGDQHTAREAGRSRDTMLAPAFFLRSSSNQREGEYGKGGYHFPIEGGVVGLDPQKKKHVINYRDRRRNS